MAFLHFTTTPPLPPPLAMGATLQSRRLTVPALRRGPSPCLFCPTPPHYTRAAVSHRIPHLAFFQHTCYPTWIRMTVHWVQWKLDTRPAGLDRLHAAVDRAGTLQIGPFAPGRLCGPGRLRLPTTTSLCFAARAHHSCPSPHTHTHLPIPCVGDTTGRTPCAV